MRELETITWTIASLVFGCLIFIEVSAVTSNITPSDFSRITPGFAGEMIDSDRSSAADLKSAAQSSNSGLEGITYFKVISGVPGGQTTARPASVEFAIAPMENDQPSYDRPISVKSDEHGNFKIALPPGKYWLGPKGKVLNPNNYVPGSFSVSEDIVVVQQGTFTKIDVFQLGYAP